MKPVLLLALCLAPALTAAEPAAVPPPPDPAAVLRIVPAGTTASPAQQQVSAQLPAYDPAAPRETRSNGTVGTPSPGVLELPKMTIRKPKERPRLTPNAVITNKGLEQKLSPLDGKLLNKYGWLGGQTAAERAREEQRLREKDALMQDVSTFARALEVTDPAQAKALRDAAAKP